MKLFWAGGRARGTSVPGSGLGLAIVSDFGTTLRRVGHTGYIATRWAAAAIEVACCTQTPTYPLIPGSYGGLALRFLNGLACSDYCPVDRKTIIGVNNGF